MLNISVPMLFTFALDLANEWEQVNGGKEEEEWNMIMKKTQSTIINAEVLDLSERSSVALVQVSMVSLPCRVFALG